MGNSGPDSRDMRYSDGELVERDSHGFPLPRRQPIGPDTIFPLQDEELTRDKIRSSVHTAPLVHHMGSVRVVRVQSDVIVKYGPTVELQEARNMSFVRQATEDVNLPTVFDSWSDPECTRDRDNEPDGFDMHIGPVTYIVMSFVDGTHLKEMWPGMTEQERTEILTRICQMLRALQLVKADRPGPIGGGKCHGFFFTEYDAGPFESVEDLQYWFNNRLRVEKHFRRVPEDHPSFVMTNDLVMCHMDLHMMNIIVDARGMPWLVDWGNSGAFPPYFEAANMLYTRGWEMQKQLYQLFNDPKHEEQIRRLEELTYSFRTGATMFRADLGIGDDY